MHMLKGWIALIALVVGCTGARSGDLGEEKPAFRFAGDGFLILDAEVRDCPAPGTPDASKLFPSRQEIAVRFGSARAEFMVLMAEEIPLENFPALGALRDSTEEHPAIRARAEQMIRSQGCVLEALEREGARYIQSFWLINALAVELTLEQADALSALPDVRMISLSQLGAPPF